MPAALGWHSALTTTESGVKGRHVAAVKRGFPRACTQPEWQPSRIVGRTSHQAAIWLMDGATPIAQSGVGSNPGPSWHEKATADFNADGMADILLQNDNGQAAIWLINGLTSIAETGVSATPGPSWHIKDAGDFNADGKADILWQHDNGQAAIWLMNATTVVQHGRRWQQSRPGVARESCRRLQRRWYGRHPVGRTTTDRLQSGLSMGQPSSAKATLAPIPARVGMSRMPKISTATARPTFCGRTGANSFLKIIDHSNSMSRTLKGPSMPHRQRARVRSSVSAPQVLEPAVSANWHVARQVSDLSD